MGRRPPVQPGFSVCKLLKTRRNDGFQRDNKVSFAFTTRPEQNGPVTMVSFSERKGRATGPSGMTVIVPPPVFSDPPMYGTSLAAVKPRNGIRPQPGNPLPVLYLQWDTHSIATHKENVGTLPGHLVSAKL